MEDIQTLYDDNEDYCKPIKQKIRLVLATLRVLVINAKIYQLSDQHNMSTVQVSKVISSSKNNKTTLNFISVQTYGANKK